MRLKIEKSFLIFVEGIDDKAFFEELLKQKAEDIQIINVGGRDNFKESLKMAKNADNFECVKKLLVIRDADERASSAYQQLENVLKEVFGDEKEIVNISQSCHGKYGILILPPSEEKGSLEDVLFSSIEKKLQTEIEKFVNKMIQIYESDQRKFKKTAKYKVHCYIGYQCNKQLYLKLSDALKNCKAFDLSKPIFNKLKDKIINFFQG
jgi:hypothetical protein